MALGVREDGQKVLLAVKNMGGESEAAWRALLDDLVKCGLKTPELVIVDGAPGLDAALAVLWSDVAIQRCTVHKHRNLLAHAPERLHEEISNDYKDMIYAHTKQEIATKRKAFIRKWRLKCKAVAASLEEAGDKLFTFTRFPKSQWKSIRTSNAIERLHEEFKRRIKTQTVLPSAETAAMLFWALLASVRLIEGPSHPRASELCAQASGNWRVSDDGGLEIHRNPIGIVTMLRACGPSGSSVAEGMKKISCNGYRFPPRMRALKSSSDFRSWVNSDFRDMVLPANLVSLGFGSRAETQTEARAAHRQKRCVRLPTTQPRPRPVRPRPSGHGAPQSLAGLGFLGGAKFPAPGFEFPARDQIRL